MALNPFTLALTSRPDGSLESSKCNILRYIIICPGGLVIVTWILCYLSEVVVLKLTSAGLYLECRPLDLHTGAPDFAAGEYAAG